MIARFKDGSNLLTFKSNGALIRGTKRISPRTLPEGIKEKDMEKLLEAKLKAIKFNYRCCDPFKWVNTIFAGERFKKPCLRAIVELSAYMIGETVAREYYRKNGGMFYWLQEHFDSITTAFSIYPITFTFDEKTVDINPFSPTEKERTPFSSPEKPAEKEHTQHSSPEQQQITVIQQKQQPEVVGEAELQDGTDSEGIFDKYEDENDDDWLFDEENPANEVIFALS